MSETPSTPTPQPEAKQIASTPSHLKLIKWEASSFAGLHESIMDGKSLVVFFDPEKPIMGAEGDQATGKTSTLNCLKALMGGEVVENAVNAKDGTIKASLTIERGDSTYVVKMGKSDFSLTEIRNLPNGASTNAKVSQPKTVLKNLIGPIGGDPMFLKGLDGAGQINWLQQMFVLSPDIIQGKADVERQIKEAYDERTNVNRDLKNYKAFLDSSKHYEWDAKEKRFKTVPSWGMSKVAFSKDIVEIERKLQDDLTECQHQVQMKKNLADVIIDRRRNIEFNETANAQDQTQIIALEQKIIEIKSRIATRERDTVVLNGQIEFTNTEIEKLSDVEEKNQKANRAFMAHGDYKLNKKQFLDDEANHKSFEDYYAKSTALTVKLISLEKMKMAFAQSITPDIDGLEVCVHRAIDQSAEAEQYRTDNPEAKEAEVVAHVNTVLTQAAREGIFYKGRSVAQLSESELFDLWIRLCKELQINVVFIENISSLGTSAIEAINSFAAAGGHIFYSAMERGKSELKISFYNKIK